MPPVSSHSPSVVSGRAMSRPKDVGILGIEVYFPHAYVDQADLEEYDGVSAGKYTKGLGQVAMAFAGGNEDAVSMSLTVVHALMDKFSISPHSVGRLEVGTESGMDRSKSIKSFLMTLFKESGNSDVQGVDCVNACYGGTAALFNAVNWVESSSWDGRYAIVVAADMAMYAAGPARASGGCGAVAMLIGPNAPLILEPGFSASYMDHVYDFYKPAGAFPMVEGRLSIDCYLTALYRCFASLCQKAERLQSNNAASTSAAQQGSYAASPEEAGRQTSKAGFSLADVDFCVMHAPLAKMVRKGFARLAFQDEVRRLQSAGKKSGSSVQEPGVDVDELSSESDHIRQKGARVEELLAKGSGSEGGHRSGTEARNKELDGTQVAQVGAGEESVNKPLQQGQPGRWPVRGAAEQRVNSEGGGQRDDFLQDKLLRRQTSSRPPLSVEADATQPSSASAAILCSEGRRTPENLQRYESLVEHYAKSGLEPSLDDSAMEKTLVDASAAAFERMVQPGTLLGLQCGNMYAASVYASLASLVYNMGGKLVGKRLLVYSYGSGLAATLYCIRAQQVDSEHSLSAMSAKLNLEARLAARRRASPEEFTATLASLEREHGACDYQPDCPAVDIQAGVYYLEAVDKLYRRKYKCRGLSSILSGHTT